MTDADLDRLAELIAAELRRHLAEKPETVTKAPWLLIPVRPNMAPPPGDPPPWAASALALTDVAPNDSPQPPAHRTPLGELTAAVRAAAAGRGPGRARQRNPTPRGKTTPRSSREPFEVSVAVSNRHIHLSAADAISLFGSTPLAIARPLTQPGQFAALQRLTVIGPTGRIDGVRVVGPAREQTQVELSRSDCHVLGITPPVANSGDRQAAGGDVTLQGPAGELALTSGVIVAARHLHLAPNDGARWQLADGDTVTVRVGSGARQVTFHNTLVRCGPTHATELHLDVDEARSADVRSGSSATVVEATPRSPQRRALITERDVARLAAAGRPLPDNALLTPSARDRARALGLTPP